MFKKLTKFIRNQMDPYKDFIPVESIADNEHFKPLCLLTKKRKSKHIFHPAPYYQHTGLTLDHVLLPGGDGKSIETLQQDSSPFTLTKTSTDQVDGGLSISVDPASVELQGAASLSNVFSIKLQKRSISRDSLETLRRKRGINMDHSFIRQLRQTDRILYVVIETLEASEEAVYKESTKANGGFKAKFYATLSAKGTRANNQSIVIPKGCTLAFRTFPIHIIDGPWDLRYFSKEIQEQIGLQGPSQGKFGIVLTEVKYSCRIFPKLSPDVLLVILNTIKAVMGDNNLLQELSHKVSEALLTATI
ncbi:gasdermin-A3-like [Prinia subflava]|uniref:gasdermin-A3-like n=1 Tax=Prinia subflava TaxID=208062 RepID=UPI002FE18C97